MLARFTMIAVVGSGMPCIGEAQLAVAGAASSPPMLMLHDPEPGYCRLLVRADGSAVVVFGASPRRAEVRAGTFNLDELLATFETMPRSEGSGGYSVSDAPALPSSDSDQPAVPDADFMRGLFAQAWEARVEPAGLYEAEDHRFVRDICGFR